MKDEETDAAALQAALEDSLGRIHRHQRRTPDDVGELLDLIGARLFTPDLGTKELRRTCPPDSDTYRRFVIELGYKPAAYFKRRLFDMACHLVSRSAVRVGVIAEWLGFPEPDLFSKWFRRHSGMAPEKLRAAQQATRPATVPTPPPTRERRAAWIWHQCLLHCAGPEEAASLLTTLREAYPRAARTIRSRSRGERR